MKRIIAVCTVPAKNRTAFDSWLNDQLATTEIKDAYSTVRRKDAEDKVFLAYEPAQPEEGDPHQKLAGIFVASTEHLRGEFVPCTEYRIEATTADSTHDFVIEDMEIIMPSKN